MELLLEGKLNEYLHDIDEELIGLLERKYNIKAYIDSLDKSMPKKTSGETASKIKQRINRCNKFILLATNGAVESKATYFCRKNYHCYGFYYCNYWWNSDAWKH